MKRVIIAGSEGLIGSEVYKFLSARGYDCHCLDISLGHDLTDEEFNKQYFKQNKADVLINLFALNHHIDYNISKSNLFNITLDSFKKYMDVNVTALFSVCREYARNNSGGCIINFSSTYGVNSPRQDLYDGEEKHIGYSTSKAAVLMLSKHLATHLAPSIRVNTIIPGGVYNMQSDVFINKYNANTPMGRMMRVSEINGAVEYLLSDSASYTTGAELKVDGGWTSW